MNPLVFPFGSGWSFFVGVGCVVAAAALSLRTPRRARQLAFFGIGGGAGLSATPMPWWMLAALTGATVWWWLRPMRKATRFAIAGAWLAAAGIELPHHFLPTFTLPEQPVIGVVGDSLTTGLGQTEEGTWPRQLREGFRLDVRSAAQPGAKCASALKQADVLGDAPNVVVVEIGGNDLFGAMWNPDGVAEYEQRYDALLTKLARPGRQLLGVELPLPPWCPHWGAAQRRVAGKHGVALIPKWRLLAILCSRGATADGIHPTRAGQDRLTALFAQALGLPKPRQ